MLGCRSSFQTLVKEKSPDVAGMHCTIHRQALMLPDGTPAMLGCRSSFQTLVKEKSPDVAGMHCTIHRQAIMAKTLPDQLKNVLDDVVKAVNVIKANALNSRPFAELCKKNDSEYVTLLIHFHVRWLSKGKVLKRVFILRLEIKDFLQGPKPELHQKFSDDCFWTCLSFLVNMFFFSFSDATALFRLLILSIWRYKERRLI